MLPLRRKAEVGVARAHNLLSTLVYSIYILVLYSYLRGEERRRLLLVMMREEGEERMDCMRA